VINDHEFSLAEVDMANTSENAALANSAPLPGLAASKDFS